MEHIFTLFDVFLYYNLKKDVLTDGFFNNVFQLPKWTPPTPVQASRARWMGVRIHVLLRCFDGFPYDSNCVNDELQPQILTGDQRLVANRSGRWKLLF
jgi:hypothetical protein